jgi:exopolysaccharide biosynthesis polyprenyl glycosylphosphotransferase
MHLITIFEMVLVSLWMVLVRRLFLKLYPPHKMIVVSSEYSPEDMLMKLQQRNDRYDICKTVSMKDGMEQVAKEVLNYEAVLLYDLGAKERNDMLKFCFDHSIRTYLTPKVSDIIISGMETIYLFDSPLYLARNMGLSPMQRAIKRLADILISLLGIIISSPIMLIVAICIKACDHGPVFYRQERLTLNGKSFRILKFRSMYVNSEKGVAQLARKHDSRITPVGKVIRNLHFDELPQFFNVLAGDMSIVGPRPERPEIFKQYEESIPEFVFRLKVKAGLTGFAQVHGRYNTTPIDKLKYDMIYIQNFSLIMDLKLMLLTFKILFQKETSEGVDDCQRTAMKDSKR